MIHLPVHQGNGWSHQYARRQWSLADVDHLRYKHLLAWDQAMMQLDDRWMLVVLPLRGADVGNKVGGEAFFS